MYKNDPSRPKPDLKEKEETEISQLKTKLRQVTELVTSMKAQIDTLNKTVRRQNNEINSILSKVNRPR
jgi:peptidoglycan hydrolase CwlO-like protein